MSVNNIILFTDTCNVVAICITIYMMLAGSYDKCVTALRERHKDDMAAVTATIFSHAQVREAEHILCEWQ
jgi:Acetyl-CoA carboxylase, central region.